MAPLPPELEDLLAREVTAEGNVKEGISSLIRQYCEKRGW